jgi:hypothetical protein
MYGNSVAYNFNSLQNGTFIVDTIDHESPSSKTVALFPLAHENRSSVAFVNYPTKNIKISGRVISQVSIQDLDVLLDTFRGYFIGQEQFLDIGYGGSIRRYIATLTDSNITRPGGLQYATFTLTFATSQAFGQDVAFTTLLNATTRTASTYSDAVTFNGNAPAQLPIFTITYTAISGGSAQTVYVGNNANGQQIGVSRNWIAGDVLQVDVTKRLVTVNGISLDFTGAFPEFPPGAQSMSYSDGFTTRTFNHNIIYYPMWL